jgi:hypothetical protein
MEAGKLAPGERDAAVGAGSGGRVEEGSRERHGSVSDLGPRQEDAENVTLPPVFFRRLKHVTMV